jgi:ATP-dependent RNA helicase DHX29
MRCGATFTSRLTPAIHSPSIPKLNQHPISSSAKPFSTPPTPVDASDGETPSTFDSDEELEPSILHARLRLQILTLRRSGRPETDPKVTALMKKQKEVARNYMFNASDAEREFLSLKLAMDEADLKARLRGESCTTGVTTEGKKRARKSISKPPPDSPAPATEDEEDEEETMFNTMLDEMPTTELSNSGTTITVRNLPVPKHARFAKSPKTLLSETARKIDKYAVASYELISGSSKAVRVKCDVRWNGGRTSEWRMDGVACWDREQAEWFVSTIALHALAYPLPDEDEIRFSAGGGAQSGPVGTSVPVVGNFPPPYRDLWSELEEERKRKEAARNRKVWKCLSEVANARGVAEEVGCTHLMTISAAD